VITKIYDFRTTSLAGPQPYEGDKREFLRCVAGFLRVRVETSNASLGGNSMVGFHVLQDVEEVNGDNSSASCTALLVKLCG
jgi:hypothetical protein